MIRSLFLIIIFILAIVSCQKDNTTIHKIINSDPELKKIASPDSPYEVQIIYTQIGSDDTGYPIFTSHDFNVDSEKYFYPASTVKMPIAFLAMEKLNELKINGLNRKTTMLIDSTRPPQTNAHIDTTTHNQLPNIERYIEKIFIASDNDAFNRLYEFLGQEYINERLQTIGAFTNSKIVHRLGSSNYSVEDNRNTNRVRFISGDSIIHTVEPKYCSKDFETVKNGLIRGIGYKNSKGELIESPFDFTNKNAISLSDLEGILRRVIYPENFEKDQQFNLNRNDLNFLLKTMTTLPNESDIKEYQDSSYFDSYMKFFMFGDSREPIPENFKIYNKVGEAYGFLIDCAFIQDLENEIEFFLTACINVNKNQIYNDNNYEYTEIGFPFLSRLGRKVYEYELSSKDPRTN